MNLMYGFGISNKLEKARRRGGGGHSQCFIRYSCVSTEKGTEGLQKGALSHAYECGRRCDIFPKFCVRTDR